MVLVEVGVGDGFKKSLLNREFTFFTQRQSFIFHLIPDRLNLVGQGLLAFRFISNKPQSLSCSNLQDLSISNRHPHPKGDNHIDIRKNVCPAKENEAIICPLPLASKESLLSYLRRVDTQFKNPFTFAFLGLD